MLTKLTANYCSSGRSTASLFPRIDHIPQVNTNIVLQATAKNAQTNNLSLAGGGVRFIKHLPKGSPPVWIEALHATHSSTPYADP